DLDAGGIYANEIGALAGVRVPLAAMAHQYLVARLAEAVPESLPTMRDPDLLVYFRREAGGLVMGGYERNPAPWGLDGIPQDFNNRLLEADWERFLPLSENAVRRVPGLEGAEIIRLINGPEAFTPDNEFILGPSRLRGFYVAAGFCAHGIAGAGGMGRQVASWIVDGEPELDLWRMDIQRPAGWAGEHWSAAIAAEHQATRERVALFDETSFAKIAVAGPGALAFLQRLCANDVDRAPGSIVYTSMLNSRGGIECDFTVTRLEEESFAIITGTAFGTHDLEWISRH